LNLLIYKKIYHNNLELKKIYTMRSKQVHNVYRFMYHYICKLRINLISQYFPPSWEIWVFPAFLPTLKAINIYRQFTLYKNICYHYTNENYLIIPSLFVMTARPQCALWSRSANSFLARYAGDLYEFLFEAYLRIKFWKFSNSDVLLKLNIYKILLYDAYHICGVKRLVRSQPPPIPSSYSNETMPNAEQFMLTLSEHQTIRPVLVGVYMTRALVLVMFVFNYVVVLFSFDIVTNVLILPCIFLLIAYIIWHLPNIFFSQNLNTSIYNCVSNCQEYSLKLINKTAGFVKCFFLLCPTFQLLS
jgi:hypothetical protein